MNIGQKALSKNLLLDGIPEGTVMTLVDTYDHVPPVYEFELPDGTTIILNKNQFTEEITHEVKIGTKVRMIVGYLWLCKGEILTCTHTHSDGEHTFAENDGVYHTLPPCTYEIIPDNQMKDPTDGKSVTDQILELTKALSGETQNELLSKIREEIVKDRQERINKLRKEIIFLESLNERI